jgi:hypothetical protein
VGVRRYGSESLKIAEAARRRAEEARDARLREGAGQLRALLATLPPLKRGRFPADDRWNRRRRRCRALLLSLSDQWLWVGKADGSGFERTRGPHRLPDGSRIRP